MNKIFKLLLACFCLSSCASRLTTVPGTSNTLHIDLMDPVVSYSRIEGSTETFSTFGIYSGGDLRYVDVLVEWERPASGLSMLATTVYTSLTLRLLGDEPNNADINVTRFLSSFLIAGTINEAMWRPANVKRANTEGLMETVRNSSVADFYTNPRIETTMRTRLFSTKYQVKSRMISGSFPENSIKRDKLLDPAD